MGYSIYIHLKKREVPLVSSFIDELEKRGWFEHGLLEYVRGPVLQMADTPKDEQLGYVKDRHRNKGRIVGFDYGERNMAHLCLYYLAKKLRKASFVYDGQTIMPLPDDLDKWWKSTIEEGDEVRRMLQYDTLLCIMAAAWHAVSFNRGLFKK